MTNHKEAGFTLLELLIVVAIIGILASLAVANYSLFKVNAYNTTAASDARSIAPAADFASSQDPLPLSPILLDGIGSGGPIPGLPGGASSKGVAGTITISTNQYRVDVSHLKGTQCYTVDSSTGSSVSDGSCS